MKILNKHPSAIVSCTSWNKRIKYSVGLINNFINQKLLPHKIYLNLSTDEFPNKNWDIPDELNKLERKYKNLFIINWVKENTMAYKKLLPVVEYYSQYPDRIILTADDDCVYTNDYVEYMINLANMFPHNYITPGTFNPYLHGYAAAYHTDWFKSGILWQINPEECEKIPCSDHWIMRCMGDIGVTNKVIPEIANKVKQLDIPHKLTDKYKDLLNTNTLKNRLEETFSKYYNSRSM